MVNSGQQPRLFTSYLRDGVGSDDAQNRRYNRYYARFEQPDPADSSYNLSDPQSLNRYSYTQNDPVNFIDPSGLLRVQECTRDWWENGNGTRRYSSWVCVTIFDDGGGFGGGGGDVGADTDPQQTDQRKDCYDFADEVARIAKDIFDNNNNSSTNSFPHNVNAFMDALARRFTEVSSATMGGLAVLRYWSGPNPSTEFGTGGFASAFVDTEAGSDNQARHATFGLIWGYSGLALSRANDREKQGSDSNRADIALNGLTVLMGERITGGVRGHSGELSARGLADWIRNNLCAPRD